MCFDNQDHSRTYVPATADHLVLLHYSDPSLHSNATVIAAVLLPYNFSFGALSQVMPPKDRIWSNIGLGYNSSFLQQLHITSIYFHLRVRRHHHHHSPSYREKSYLIFNPSKKHYYNSKPIPFRVEMNRKRLHPMLGFTIGRKSWTNLDDAAMPRILPVVVPNTLWFHIDSGNSGISINDTFVYEHLTHVTGGKWHEEKDDDGNTSCTTAAVTTSKRLYVPFPPFHAPPLRIWLTVDVFVDIPGPSWVLDTNGTTIFSTYVKNVLGLPFITNCDFIIDDRTTTLYVLTNNNMS
jgi:hypothetical protein